MSDFTDQYGPLARDIAGQTGLQPSVVLAIIDHETGGGQHIPNNNLFGMMDSKGQPRQYVDQGGSGVDFVNLMKGPRFAKAATFTDPVDQAQAISNLGYGPGPADAAAHPDQASGAAYANSLIAKAKGYHQAGFTNDPPMTVDQAMELTKPKAAAATPAPIEPGLVPSATQIPPAMSVDDAMERTGSPRNGGIDTAPLPLQADNYASGNPMGDQFEASLPNAPAEKIMPTLLPSAHDVTSYLNAPPEKGFERSSVLPISVNPDMHPGVLATLQNQGGIRLDPRGMISGIGHLLQSNSPEQVAARGNITPDMAMMLLGAKAGNPNPFQRGIPTAFKGGSPISTAARIDDRLNTSPGYAEATQAAPASNPLAGPRVTPSESTVGAAATPGDDIPTFTKAEMDTNLVKRFNATARDRATPSGDNNMYITGEQPTLAERALDPNISTTEKQLSQNYFRNSFKGKDGPDVLNNDVWKQHFLDLADDPKKLADAEAYRKQVGDADLQKAFGGVGSTYKAVKLQPVHDMIDGMLNQGLDKRGPIAGVLQQVQDNLKVSPADRASPVSETSAGANEVMDRLGITNVGTRGEAPSPAGRLSDFETDPLRVYAIRQDVTDRLSKIGAKVDPANEAATSQLQQIKLALDAAITEASPHYPEYLKNWAENSKPINEMEYLQQYMNGNKSIMDPHGTLVYPKVQSMMGRIVKDYVGPDATAAAKSISTDTMDKLFDLRDTMARQAYSRQIARTAGSDTNQLSTLGTSRLQRIINSTPLAVGAHLGSQAVGYLTGHDPLSSGVGNILVGAAKSKYNESIMKKHSEALRKEALKHLSSDEGWEQNGGRSYQFPLDAGDNR